MKQTKAKGTAPRMKVTLEGASPAVWRRLILPEGLTFWELNGILSAAFGIHENSVFRFEAKNGGTAGPAEEAPSGEAWENASETGPEELPGWALGGRWQSGSLWFQYVLEGGNPPEPVWEPPWCSGGRGTVPGSEEEAFSRKAANSRLRRRWAERQKRLRASPDRALWRQLMDTAKEIRRLRPWKRLQADSIITLLLPGWQEPVFCVCVSELGGPPGLYVYHGYEALRGYFRMCNPPPEEPAFVTLSYQDCIMCGFADRNQLADEDVKILQDLGLRFRGKNQWVYFRSMKPGLMPWYLGAQEAELLREALEQFIGAYQAFAANQIAVHFSEGETLLRMFSREKNKFCNTTARLPALPSFGEKLRIRDEVLMKRLGSRGQSEEELEIDLFYLPIPVQESRDYVPYFPGVCVIADEKTAELRDQYICGPEEQTGNVLMTLLEQYILHRGRPRALRIRDYRTGRYLEDLCGKLKIQVIQEQGMPVIDPLARKMEQDLSEF